MGRLSPFGNTRVSGYKWDIFSIGVMLYNAANPPPSHLRAKWSDLKTLLYKVGHDEAIAHNFYKFPDMAQGGNGFYKYRQFGDFPDGVTLQGYFDDRKARIAEMVEASRGASSAVASDSLK